MAYPILNEVNAHGLLCIVYKFLCLVPTRCARRYTQISRDAVILASVEGLRVGRAVRALGSSEIGRI